MRTTALDNRDSSSSKEGMWRESLHAGYSDPTAWDPSLTPHISLHRVLVFGSCPLWVAMLGTWNPNGHRDPLSLRPLHLPSPTVKLQAASLPSALWTCVSDAPVPWPGIPMPSKLSEAPCRRLSSLIYLPGGVWPITIRNKFRSPPPLPPTAFFPPRNGRSIGVMGGGGRDG